MRYLSVCSGIESASAAWHGLGWQPVAFSEIEKFPCALLAERYPSVPNLGDMLRFAEWPALKLNVLVGGTPCQSFSVAGQRGSLDDHRGNLTLVFCRIADRFDPELIVWENVPGVLSTTDNAFGCFLAELTGCDTPIDPGRVGWTDAGVVAGPKRICAWRVIDSQGFVPQRRSRVFVVAARAGSRVHPADVLFETEAEAFRCLGERAYTGPLFPLAAGVRGDLETGGEEGEDFTRDVAPSLSASGRGTQRAGESRGQDCLVAGTLGKHHGNVRADQAWGDQLVTHATRADGFDASEDGIGRGTPLVVATAEGGSVNLTRSNIGKQINNQSPLVFDTTQITSAENRCKPEPGNPCHPLARGAHAPAIAQTLRAMPHDGSHANGGGQIAVCIQGGGRTSQGSNGSGINEDVSFTLNQMDIHAIAFGWQNSASQGASASASATPTLDKSKVPGIGYGMVVRRLTPTECERLMGMADGYTLIDYRGKPAKDGPRYKALGNSMVRDVMLWIGQRIERLAA